MFKKILKNVNPLHIVADGMISSAGIGDGRFIPMIILQTHDRPDIDELFRVHKHTPPGDVVTQWATIPFKNKLLVLQLKFDKPMKCSFEILFNVDKNGALIDSIMHAQAVYLQPGQPGDTVSGSISKDLPRIIAEVPRSDYFKKWDSLIHKVMTKKMRANGLDRNSARKAAGDVIKSAREVWGMRRN